MSMEVINHIKEEAIKIEYGIDVLQGRGADRDLIDTLNRAYGIAMTTLLFKDDVKEKEALAVEAVLHIAEDISTGNIDNMDEKLTTLHALVEKMEILYREKGWQLDSPTKSMEAA